VWKSDGTNAGTVPIKDIRPGTASSFPAELTIVDSTLYFSANDGVHGLELWKTDGTASGTTLLKDLTPGPGSATGYTAPHLSELTGVNHKLYFVATTAGPSIYDATKSLWVSDGTEAGTRRLTLYPEVSFGFTAAFPTEFKGAAYFFAGGGETLAMWRTMGSVQTTVPFLQDVAEPYSNYVQPTRVYNYLYYIGHETLNRTDGTVAGTKAITGIEATSEQQMSATAYNPMVTGTAESTLTVFPSPFQTDFRLELSGTSEITRAVSVFNAYGVEVESGKYAGGHTYTLGSDWLPGLYLINITTDHGIVTKRIFKK
jgi:ELWxxDGT repeat protein